MEDAKKNTVKGKIEAVSSPKEFNGILQIGFKVGNIWYNIPGEEDELKKLLDLQIKKGNEIEFSHEGRVIEDIIGFVPADINKEGDDEDMVDFETLLNDAHEKGIQSIETECKEINMEKKYAIFMAKVTMKDNTLFEATGDATQDNCSDMVKKHFIRMAETRSIVRALRWATNNAQCSEEEK